MPAAKPSHKGSWNLKRNKNLMVSTGRKVTFILIAVLLFLLLGSAQAMSCEDMPCCTVERAAVSEVDRSDNCRQCNPVSCSCSIQSSTPDYQQSETGLFTCFHFEMESTEEATSLVLPVVEPKTSGELKPFGCAEEALPPDDEDISYWAFPNPPPSVYLIF